MAQWGSLPIAPEKLRRYPACRDLYVEAETLAQGDRYRHLDIPWKLGTISGNPALPAGGDRPAPVVITIHGIDGCKEEHPAPSFACKRPGLPSSASMGLVRAKPSFPTKSSGPMIFFMIVRRAVDVLQVRAGVDTERTGLFGISIGGMWGCRRWPTSA